MYETVLKPAHLTLFLGAFQHYGRKNPGDIEAIALPITVANRGARDAIVVSLELLVANDKGQRGRYLAAYAGANAENQQPFAPPLLPGRGSYTSIVVFHPQEERSKALINGTQT